MSDEKVTNARGFVVWMTGLPGAGKTTLARRLETTLQERAIKVEVLDGEALRSTLSRDLGFAKEDRDAHIRRIGFVAGLLARNGITAIVAAISPYRDVRAEIRREVRDFVEVYVRCPIEVLMRRDTKGLYSKAVSGEIANFTGISDPYEEPLEDDVTLDTDRLSEEESLACLVGRLEEMGLLRS